MRLVRACARAIDEASEHVGDARRRARSSAARTSRTRGQPIRLPGRLVRCGIRIPGMSLVHPKESCAMTLVLVLTSILLTGTVTAASLRRVA